MSYPKQSSSSSDTVYVLIADDDPIFRSILERSLHIVLPHVVVSQAGTGDEALTILQQTAQNLVISDHHMVGMTGVDLLKLVRYYGSQTPFIICSGDKSIQPAALSAGATAFLLKPLRLEALFTVLRQCHFPIAT